MLKAVWHRFGSNFARAGGLVSLLDSLVEGAGWEHSMCIWTSLGFPATAFFDRMYIRATVFHTHACTLGGNSRSGSQGWKCGRYHLGSIAGRQDLDIKEVHRMGWGLNMKAEIKISFWLVVVVVVVVVR